MINWVARLVIICWFLIRHAHGFGSGAPPSQCGTMQPVHSNIPSQNVAIPYTLSSSSRTYSVRETIEVTLSSIQNTAHRGFLIKAEDSNGNLAGTMIPGDTSNQKTITCGTNFGDSITHKTKLDKLSSTFSWKAPNNLVGDVFFRVTVVQNYSTFWVDHELLALFAAEEIPETTTVLAPTTTSASSDTETPSTAPSASETEPTTPGVTDTPQAQTTFVSTTDSTKLTTTPFPVEVITNIFTSTQSYSHVTRNNTTQVFHNLSNPMQGFTPYFTNSVTIGQADTGIHNTETTMTSSSTEGNVTQTANISSVSVGDSTNINDSSGNIGERTNRNITTNSTDMPGTTIAGVQSQLENLTKVSPLRQSIPHTVTRTTRDVSKMIEMHGVTTVTSVPSQTSSNVDNMFLTSSPTQKTTKRDQQHLIEQQTVTTRDDVITHISDILRFIDLDSTTATQRESMQPFEKSTQVIDQSLDHVSHTTVDTYSNATTATDRSDTVTTTSIKSNNGFSSEAGISTSSKHMPGTIPTRFPKPKTGKFDKDVQIRTDETTPRISKTLPSLPPVKTVMTGQQDGKIAYDPECGSSKGCFVKCKGENCEFMVTWRDVGNAVRFEIYGKPDGAAPEAWVAVGFSTDTRMGEDSVTECVYTNGMVQAFNSYNRGYSNTRLMNPQRGLSQIQGNYVNGILMCSFVRDKQVPGVPQVFNLEQDWHIMYANGRALSVPAWSISMHSLMPNNYPQTSAVMVDYQSYVVVGSGAKYPLVKAHGCLMIFAWVLFTGVGIVAARYYKNVWVDKTFMKLKIWFQVHRFSMVAAVLCNAIAFIIIFVEVGGYSNIPDIPGKSYLRSHPVIGIIITILSVTNPLMALFRPDPEHSKRPIFNWAHWGVGMAAYILSTICICFGFQLGKSHTPDYAIYIMIVYVTYIIIFDIALEMMEVLAKREKQGKVEQVEMSNVASNGTESSIPNGNTGSKGKVKKTDKTKTLLLAVHMAFTGAFALVLVLVVALN